MLVQTHTICMSLDKHGFNATSLVGEVNNFEAVILVVMTNTEKLCSLVLKFTRRLLRPRQIIVIKVTTFQSEACETFLIALQRTR